MADDAGGGAVGGGNNKIILIATILNTVGMLAVIVLAVLGFQKESARVSVDDIQANAESGHGAEGGDHGAGGDHGGGGGGGHGGGGGGGHGAAAGEKKGPSDIGKIVPMDVFQVNLAAATGSQPRFLRMNMALELEINNSDEEVKGKTPRIRDVVINLLNSKKPADLASPEGRDLLKDEIRRTTNSFLKESQVKNVYFTNFAIGN